MNRWFWGLLLIGSVAANAATFTVTSTAQVGAGSLSQAILDANNSAGADTINFNIAGAGVKIINISGLGLPSVNETLTINGYSQPGSAVNSAAAGSSNAVLSIELDASSLNSLNSALELRAPVTLRGLAIHSFASIQSDAIRVFAQGAGSSIRGCFLGTHASGIAPASNQETAINVGAAVQIGGTAPADRNLIAASNAGIALFAGADGTLIQGNLFGTTAAGTGNQGNRDAIRTGNVNVNNIMIGGTVAGGGNVIANSLDSGIELFTPISATAGFGISILGNSITNSGVLGIDLGDDGVDSNDPTDADSGINGRENAPELSFARLNGNLLRVYGKLDGNFLNGIKRVEFFASPAANPSGFGEGQIFLGSINVDPGGIAVAFLRPNLTLAAIPALPFVVTATSTNFDGSTSEFSNAIAVVDGGTVRTVTNVADSGAGSLRQAMLDAAAAGTDTIVFNIAGNGPHVIAPITSLPLLSGSTLIDGYSQSFSRENNLALGSNADLRIALDFSSAGANSGLQLTGGSSIIRGVVIANAGNVGITASGGSNHRIEGNFIGTDATGMLDRGSNSSGISVAPGVNGVRIGGSNRALRNLVSGNNGAGISVAGNNAEIIGNVVGTGADGNTPLGNSFAGINMGGTGGMVVDNRVRSNGSRGISVVSAGSQAALRANAVGANAGLGIDLNIDGVTANDVDDVDSGPNGLQNFPVLTLAEATLAGGAHVGGILDRPAGAAAFAFELDVFRSSSCDGSSNGEGENFLFSQTLNFAAGSPETFEVTVPGVTLAAGDIVTATVTDAGGNTSEFSACRTALLQPQGLFGNGFE